MKELLPIQHDVPHCFGCGRENPSGMKLRFTREDEKTVSTNFTPPEDWTGWGKMLHGGFSALLLDEVTAWTAWVCTEQTGFVTASLDLKYLRPTYVEQPITAYGQIVEDREKDVIVHGWTEDTEKNKLTEVIATIRRIDLEKLQRMQDNGST